MGERKIDWLMGKWMLAAPLLLIAAALCLGQEPTTPPKAAPEQPDAETFSDAVAGEALNQVRDGLEAHSQTLMLAAFDREKMQGYRAFEDQITAYFERYEGFRVRYRILQTMLEGARGIALVEFEVEQTPRGDNSPPQRRSAQLRFELERAGKSWKFVEVQPRSFFS